ncbi:MAG: hypothetical protein ACLT8Y_03815 [Dorea formicigenerans]
MTKRKTAKNANIESPDCGKQKLKTQVAESRNSDDFIMFPTVDFCFKELMQNEKVRKGIISAILSVDPKDVDSSKQPLSINHLFFFPNKYIITLYTKKPVSIILTG